MKQLIKSMLGSYYTPKMKHLKRQMEVRYLGKGEPELALLPRLVDPGKVAIDIGANIGDFLDVLARHASRAIAFEPNPVCLAHLRAIELERYEIVDIALSDSSGTATLKVPVEAAEVTGLGTIEATNNPVTGAASALRTYEVRTARLDEVIGEHLRPGETIGFIKIDVEGHEHAVLEGAKATIERHRPIVMVETEYRHGAPVPAIFEFSPGSATRRGSCCGAGWRRSTPCAWPSSRAASPSATSSRTPTSIYINNVWFVPQERLGMLADLG